ncbi:hypothetical protein YC2023_070376 [Brassica napus]
MLVSDLSSPLFKLLAFTWNIEEWIPPPEKYIFKFHSKEDLKKWHLYSDSEYGGLSSASLEIPDGGKGSDGTGIFSGNLSVDLSEGSKWNISRSGFCGMRSKKFDGFIDLDGYDAIAMRLRGDGRCYISTDKQKITRGKLSSLLQRTGGILPRQIEIMSSLECFASSLRPLVTGVLIIYQIPLARYLPTWRGNVIDVEMEMNPGRVLGMSLSVNAEGGAVGAKSGAGDFRVEIDWIKALRMP